MVRIAWLFLVVLSAASCDFKARQQAVAEKETQLTAWEQQLNLREKTLALKEEELQQRQHALDSLQHKSKADSTQSDSTAVYNAAIMGLWNVKMECTETTCAGSAVG